MIEFPYVAVDYGSALYVSYDGKLGVPFKDFIGKNGGLVQSKDFVALVAKMFKEGYNVVTEASTIGSFRMLNRHDEITALIEEYGLNIYTMNTHTAYNQACKLGLVGPGRQFKDKEAFSKSHNFAASLIYEIFARYGGRKWRPRNPEEVVEKKDPVRPFKRTIVTIRSEEYPEDIMKVIYDLLPPWDSLTEEQKQLMSGNQSIVSGYADDQAAALICSLTEPKAGNREQWRRIIGDFRDSRPSIYRQMLVVGASKWRDQESYDGSHFSGLTLSGASKARRQIRTLVLEKYPDLPGTQLFY